MKKNIFFLFWGHIQVQKQRFSLIDIQGVKSGKKGQFQEDLGGTDNSRKIPGMLEIWNEKSCSRTNTDWDKYPTH